MILLLLAACAGPIDGVVTSASGEPVAGASLQAPGCGAVTGDDGRFSVQCADEPRTFVVSHPAYLGAKVEWTAGELAVVLTPIPTAPGVYVADGPALDALSPAVLERRGDETTGWTFCFRDAGEGARSTAAGDLRLLDIHDVDWRLFPAGSDGCVYSLQHANGEWWTSPSVAIPVRKDSELAPGRSWVTVTLAAGDYALVDWYAGSPVPDAGGGYSARRLRVR